VQQLSLTPPQVEKVRAVLTETKESLAEIQERAASAGDRDVLKNEAGKLRQDEAKKLWATLNPQQQQGWRRLVGADFDLSRVTPGPFKAPEFQPAATWINSDGEKLSDLRGQVVVVHFYCFGCINCIHNFPSYRNWLKHFQGRDVTIIGIHTPETQRERNVETIRQRAAAEQLDFPILVDTEKKNWNAWGNTMWPTVYLIDKRGYLRNWWQGELNWQGATGEQQMLQKIEALLAE
jgi:peroxiredoxin